MACFRVSATVFLLFRLFFSISNQDHYTTRRICEGAHIQCNYESVHVNLMILMTRGAEERAIVVHFA